jgi:hypothetical protein
LIIKYCDLHRATTDPQGMLDRPGWVSRVSKGRYLRRNLGRERDDDVIRA